MVLHIVWPFSVNLTKENNLIFVSNMQAHRGRGSKSNQTNKKILNIKKLGF